MFHDLLLREQGQLLPVKHGISVITDPVAEVNIPADTIAQREIYRQMAMSKYKIIKIRCLQYFFTINDQPFLVFSQECLINLPGDRPAAAAEPVRQPYAKSRRKNAEQPLADLVTEYFFYEFIAMISRPQAISMA